jgi:AraC family transcriptional regulator
MDQVIQKASAASFRSALRVAPELARETGARDGFGIYAWNTPQLDGFALPENDELVLALHLGGSDRVRAVTDRGLSRGCSVPGLMTVLPPGRAAAFRTDGGVRFATFHVPRTALARTFAASPAGSAPLTEGRFAFRDDFVSAGIEAILRVARSGSDWAPDYVARIGDAILLHLACHHGTAQAPSASTDARLGGLPLAEFLAFIDARLGTALPLDELAQRTRLSRSAFTRAFRAATGVSPHRYLTERRLAAAQRLLRTTGLPIAFIAQETGFSSQSHFTTIFRAAMNCTPAEYRRAGETAAPQHPPGANRPLE